MWSLLLLRMHTLALQAPNVEVPLRQDLSSLDSWQLASQLLSTDCSTNECVKRIDFRWRRQYKSASKHNSLLRDSSFKKSKILLQKRPQHVLLKVYSQAHWDEAWSHTYISEDRGNEEDDRRNGYWSRKARLEYFCQWRPVQQAWNESA